MADTPQEIREQLTAALDAFEWLDPVATVKTHPYISEDVTPPAVSVVPGQPYLRPLDGNEGGTFLGLRQVRYDVLLLVPKVEAKRTADLIDALIWQALAALDDFDPGEVSQPQDITVNGADCVGSTITIERETRSP